MMPATDIIHLPGGSLLGDNSLIYEHALHAYRKGNLDRAEEKFGQVLHRDPNHGAAFNNLGLVYYDQTKLVQAANHFDRAVELLPGNPSPINNLGMTLEAGGRLDEAIELYEQAHALSPDTPLYLGNLLRARIRGGESGDHVVAQLQHLAFIENRAEWIQWVDEQLALFQNSMLDRGPAPSPALGRRENSALDQTRIGPSQEDGESYLAPIVPAPVDSRQMEPSMNAEVLPVPRG